MSELLDFYIVMTIAVGVTVFIVMLVGATLTNPKNPEDWEKKAILVSLSLFATCWAWPVWIGYFVFCAVRNAIRIIRS